MSMWNPGQDEDRKTTIFVVVVLLIVLMILWVTANSEPLRIKGTITIRSEPTKPVKLLKPPGAVDVPEGGEPTKDDYEIVNCCAICAGPASQVPLSGGWCTRCGKTQTYPVRELRRPKPIEHRPIEPGGNWIEDEPGHFIRRGVNYPD